MRRSAAIVVCGLFTWAVFAAPDLPAPTNLLVNDFAGVFTTAQTRTLETRLEAFSDSTSNQICVVTVSDLQGYEAGDYAQRLGQYWGVGSSKDNGVLILLKPRSETERYIDVFIATGYGIEGALTDALCKRIINNQMAPFLRQDPPDYYGAVEAAVSRIEPVMLGEYNDSFASEEDDFESFTKGLAAIIVIGSIVMLIAFFPTKKRRAKSALKNAATPDEFTRLVPEALKVGIPVAWITQLEQDMPARTLQEVRNARSTVTLNQRKRRAKAFGNSDEAISAAAAIALAAMAAMAISSARSRRSSGFYGGSSGGFSSGGHSFGGFGGGSFGGGGAGGRF